VELEKVSLNLTPAEVGQIDVLVAQGLYASRTDVIRSGIRRVIEAHQATVDRVTLGSTGMGFIVATRGELEKARAKRERLRFFVIGVLKLDNAITPELADAAIAQIHILGTLRGPAAVLKVLEDRVHRSLPSIGDLAG
jgi:Arc/MetJ-type ribon-helix-helix transcriptional regulator